MFVELPGRTVDLQDGGRRAQAAAGGRGVHHHHQFFGQSIHSELFLEAAKHGVALIICESFKPVSLVLPANRSTDTILSRAHAQSHAARTAAHLWQKTMDAKCQNQFSLAEHIAPRTIQLAPVCGNRLRQKAAQGGDLRQNVLADFRPGAER